MFDLKEGEYCVDGVVSLHAMLHIPHEKYHALLKYHASFMPNGGALLLAKRSDESGQTGEDAHGTIVSWHHDGSGDNTELIEDTGFAIILNEVGGRGEKKHQIILARS